MINRSTDGEQRVLSLSYGKDSLACIGAIEELGLPLDRIVHTEVWATDTIPADLPPMVEFKKKADSIIEERWGFKVEHYHATDESGDKLTYQDIFYREIKLKDDNGEELEDGESRIYGFPIVRGPWCNSDLKAKPLKKIRSTNPITKRRRTMHDPVIMYIGIAADEPNRIRRWENKKRVELPLVKAGWSEAQCYQWCEEMDLISPVYTNNARDGCWFCHQQRVSQLRVLYNEYPELWELLMKWDSDSPTIFKADGQTVRDYDLRFKMENRGEADPTKRFRWSRLDSYR